MKLNFIKDQTINSWNNREIINKFLLSENYFFYRSDFYEIWFIVLFSIKDKVRVMKSSWWFCIVNLSQLACDAR